MNRWIVLLVVVLWPLISNGAQRIVVGSKNFNEGYLLSEVVAQLLEHAGYEVDRRFGLGGTLICYDALKNGEIDVYIEYTGTLARAILRLDTTPDAMQLNAVLAPTGLEMLGDFGFDNTYALAMKSARAKALGITRISDLAAHRQLKIVVSHEFLKRADGWPGLARAYGFDWHPTGIEHGLAYQALEDGAIDVTDVYSTDGEIARYRLRVLDDDRNYFPEYRAAPLVRADLPARAKSAIDELHGALNNVQMQRLNSQVTFGGVSYQRVAHDLLAQRGFTNGNGTNKTRQMWRALRHNTAVHLKLTGIALAGSILFGMLLGIVVYRIRWLSRATVYIAGLLQTIPSIALLGLMIPLLGIGTVPAITALFLYSLLPILRNTVTALAGVDPVIRHVAVAIGLNQVEQLRYVYLPLSLPSILAGVRTAAVISIGTATLAAFIGAGGLGDPIVTGLALNDPGLILQGAIPAAALAIVTELLFEGIERVVVPRHLA